MNMMIARRAGFFHTKTGFAGVCALIAVSLAGCGRIGLNDPLINSGSSQTSYEPLPAAPAAAVTSSDLPPPPIAAAPTVGAPTPIDPVPAPTTAGAGTGIPVATAAPPKQAEPVINDKAPAIGRGELAGGWRIASGADNCQLYITLTSWSGGYRASTKGCNSAEMQRISAWDVAGKQVMLKSGDGAVVATLANAGQEKFSGTTASKQTITISR